MEKENKYIDETYYEFLERTKINLTKKEISECIKAVVKNAKSLQSS